MNLNIDLVTLAALGLENPLYIAGWIFVKGGWIVVAVLFLVGLYIMRLERARMKYREAVEYILLAIDVPKENEQSMKAVEQIFAQLAAIGSDINFLQRYWGGKVQNSFSLELVSIDGYIQFLIRVAEKYRDLVEAAVYAQYPDAEITEVDDYTESIPNTFPSKDYELWGTELILAKNQAYPIRTYLNFEHTLTQKFADPMASILEALSRLQDGEQIWIQLVLTPVRSGWIKNAEYLVKRLIGEKAERRKTIISPITDVARGFGDEALKQIAGGGIAATETKKMYEMFSKMQFLSPGDRNVVEAIQEKISKIGFRTKIRIIYTAKKEIFNRDRGVKPVIGAILQYNTQNLNAFKFHKKITTRAEYIQIKKRLARRQRKLIWAYKKRANYLGAGEGFVLNIEEIASIYHFPITEITAPPVQKTEIKKGGPPTTLPRETKVSEESIPSGETRIRPAPLVPKIGAPENLPMEPIKPEDKSYDQSLN